MAFFQDLQSSMGGTGWNPMASGGAAAFGDAPIQQLFDAYANRKPVRSLTSTGEGQYDYNLPDSATYGGFTIQAKPGPGGDAQNPSAFYINPTLQAGQPVETLNGTPFDVYSPDQKFQGSHTWQNVSGGTGLDKFWDVAIPIATSAFIGGGVAGAAGYGPMASGGTGGTTSGVTFGAEGVPTGFGTWDAGVAAMNSPGVTFGAGGVPTGFGTWDAGVAAMNSPGVTFGPGGVPVGFGTWDPAMAGGLEPARLMASGGFGGADLPMAFDGGGFSGLSASDVLGSFGAGVPPNPFNGMSFMEQLSNGAYSPGVLKSMASNPMDLLKQLKNAKALKLARLASTAAQLYGGMQGRKQAKALQAQMQGLIPQMQLPSAAEAMNSPGYQLGMDAVRRQMAAQGYLGSGNLMAALQEYGHRFYGDYVNQRLRSADSQLNATRAQAGPVYGGQSSLALAAQGIGNLLEFF